jgi:hypothetical protein
MERLIERNTNLRIQILIWDMAWCQDNDLPPLMQVKVKAASIAEYASCVQTSMREGAL